MTSKTMRAPMLLLAMLGVATACTPHDDVQEPQVRPAAAADPKPEPEPAPEPEETVTVSVASVQLQDDCPKPSTAARGQRSTPSPSDDEAMGDVDHGDMSVEQARRVAPGCVQSSVQLSIVSEDSTALPFSVRAVRLRKGDGGGSIETLQARTPTIWSESAYVPWDESVAANSTLNVTYLLGAPDWTAVEKVLEESSFGPLYVVEVEVEVAGRVQTVISPLAPREAIEEMVT